MYSDEDIASAVRAGVLTEHQAEAFRQHVADQRRTPAVDEERFRLVTGFNDIFVVVASLLLLASVTWIGYAQHHWLAGVLLAAASWGLAEFFVRRRRMALPAIVLLLGFVGGVGFAAYAWLGSTLAAFGYASAMACVAAWLHWLRFHVPITVAAGAGALLGVAGVVLFKSVPWTHEHPGLVEFSAGLIAFALAMLWDASDPARVTRRADVAFWLHLLAAPLLVRPVFAALGEYGSQSSPILGLAAIALYAAIAAVSLAIDRRALMASALVYVLINFSALLKMYGVVSLGFAITSLVIGSLLLLLSAFWHPCRSWMLSFFPEAALRRLPPLR